MPDLIIIAGPNGAGKSTTSQAILESLDKSITAFDLDKEFYNEWSHFDFDPELEANIFTRSIDSYAKQKTEAIRLATDFAYETNFHSLETLSTVNEFKLAGFSCSLYFIMLENEEYAMNRVRNRVLNGGHNVDEITIRTRFSKGLEMLDNSFTLFDKVNLILSGDYCNELVARFDVKGDDFTIERPLPERLAIHLPKLNKVITDHI